MFNDKNTQSNIPITLVFGGGSHLDNALEELWSIHTYEPEWTEFVKALDENIIKVEHTSHTRIFFESEIDKMFFILKYS